MNDLTLQQFLPHLNETFAAIFGEAERSFVLVEAKPISAPDAQDLAREPFSLLFFCETPEVLPQGIYRLRHPDIGEADVFLVPVARQAGGFVYQAIFN